MPSYCAILHHIADERQPNESAGDWLRRQSVYILIFQMAQIVNAAKAAASAKRTSAHGRFEY
jgi:hypothetical protein